jgi:ubiquinone biosynthesis accessory factor UbiK
MVDKKVLDELINKINDLVKNSPIQDVQKNVRAVLSEWFASHNLVTREEFDAQVEVLRRTQDTLRNLEQEIEALRKSDS